MSSRLDRVTNWEEQARLAHYRASKMAELIQVSDRHLRRYFVAHYAVSPQDWINQLRMRESRYLLLKRETVKSVAYQLGYKQVSHFCSVFKRHFGITPSASSVFRFPNRPLEITNVRRR